MALNLASPGIVVREVDLTIGRVDATSGSIGALVAPFTKGPVEDAQLIESEEDLLQTFGQPYSVDNHYEYWMVASSFLAYGGTLQVIRADDYNTLTGVGLKNAFVGTASSIRIKSDTHYNQLGYDDNTITGVTVASKTPGTYANGLRVAIIDAKADQIITASGISKISGYIANTNGTMKITIPDLTAEKPVAIGSAFVMLEAAKAAKATGGVIALATAK